MGTLIRNFEDDTFLEYDYGKFDEWCVYYGDNINKKPPLDTKYFGYLELLAQRFTNTKVYADYVSIYNMTGKEIEQSVFDLIDEIAMTYQDEALQVSKVFSILYMAMIAEEKKAFTKLGKRIKRLGIYKLLIEHWSVDKAAHFMIGMKWREIDLICKEAGF